MGWVSPTGYEDPNNFWNNEYKAYDGSLGTWAYTDFLDENSWCGILLLTRTPAINCNKVRFYAYYHSSTINTIDIDVYYDGAWHDVYQGAYASYTWVEKPIPEGTKLIDTARVRFYCVEQDFEAKLCEFEFNEAVEAPTVTTQAATNVQATTARLNGQISNDGGEACQYRFRYKKGAGGAYSYTTWTGAKATGQTFYENISGLDKKNLYYFNAQAKNSAGESAWGGELSFTTLATTPIVTTQAVSDIGATTATGHGNTTDIGGENCTKRGVCWNTTGNPTVADSKSEETDSFGVGAFERPMTGLTPGQLYYVRAYAYNSAGYGYGSQVEFTTKAYYATGYIGDVIDCTDLVKTYDRLEWTEEIPGPEQAIEIKIRSSPDLSSWTDWEVIYSSPCTSFQTPVQRYLEWVATLTTEQGTPKLKDFGFFWTKKVE